MALSNNFTGNDNIAIGQEALVSNPFGNFNIALGAFAGANLITGDNNIDIGSRGVRDESNTIRIGTVGTHMKRLSPALAMQRLGVWRFG